MRNGNGPHLPELHVEAGSTLLFLVRHGQTTWNVERRFQGQLDVPLSPDGLQQAGELAVWLGGLPVRFNAIYSSDLQRSAETAKLIAAKLGITPVYTRMLRELNAGDWQGLTTLEVEQRYPGQLKVWREGIEQFTLPGGESVLDVQERVFRYISDIVQRHKGEAIIVVSHGASLAAYIAAVHGWDLQETWDTRRARISNTGVTALALDSKGTARTIFSNWTAHLGIFPDLPSVIDPEPAVGNRGSQDEIAV